MGKYRIARRFSTWRIWNGRTLLKWKYADRVNAEWRVRVLEANDIAREILRG